MQIKTGTANEKTNVFKILLVIFVLIFAINISMIMASKNAVKQKEDLALELTRPADISLAIIKDISCVDCADITPIINAVKKTNVKVAKEETFDSGSQEGKNLIREFGLTKLPAFIARGELDKNADVKKLLSQIGEIKNGAFKFTYNVAPYFDLASNSVKGKVVVNFISDKSCAECYDISPFKQILAANLGMVNPAIVNLDKSDKAAQDLIKKYKIGEIPAFVITGEISAYPGLAGVWLDVGSLEKDGAYVLRNIKKVNPGLVYRDLVTGKVIKPDTAQAPAVSPVPTGSPIPNSSSVSK